jgi:hypothetical protein
VNELTDQQLVQDYVERRSEAAFARFRQGLTPEARVLFEQAVDETLMKKSVMRNHFKGLQIIARKVVKEDQLVELQFRHEFDGQPVEIRVQRMLKIGEDWALFGDPTPGEAFQDSDGSGQIEWFVP